MTKQQKMKSMTEILRQAIVESGLPTLTVSNEAGVSRGSLIRFIRGERSLRLDCADKLAAYFGLSLQGSRPAAGTKQARQAARTRKLREQSSLAAKAIAALDGSNYAETRRLLGTILERGKV